MLCSAAAVASGRGREVRGDRGLGVDEPASALSPFPPRPPSHPSTPSGPPAPSRLTCRARWPLGHGGLSAPALLLRLQCSSPQASKRPALSFPSGLDSGVAFLARLPWPPFLKCQHHPHTRARAHTRAHTHFPAVRLFLAQSLSHYILHLFNLFLRSVFPTRT